ncbi:MAG: Fic family protein [Reyranellales bacterium]
MTEDRYSRPVAAPLITDKLERAKRESENGLRQIDFVLDRVRRHTGAPPEPFRLRPSLLLALNRAAVDGIEATAGAFRTGGMEIFGSKHQPPKGAEVPELIEELCDYVNDHWSDATGAHLSAYVMWRINWIHPFDDGNGRTARAASYLVLSIKTGGVLPGAKAIPERIVGSKNAYYMALEKANKAYERDKIIDVSELEEIIVSALAAQLADVVMDASGKLREKK